MTVLERDHLDATRSLVELVVGRPLRQAEQAIDVLGLTRALDTAKDEIHAAIEAEKRRAIRKVLRVGGRVRFEITTAMLKPLEELHRRGRAEAAAELERLGYRVRGRRLEAFSDLPELDPLVDRIRTGLHGLEVRVDSERVTLDLGGAASDAIASALMRVPGGRSLAAGVVSTALFSGMAQTFEEHADLIPCWEYSSVLDGGTCTVCRSLDGREFHSLDELFVHLPNFGPNPACYGGGRCRCRAVPCPPDDAALRAQLPPFDDAFDTPTGTGATAVGIRDAIAIADSVHTAEVANAARVVVDRTLTRSNPGQYRRAENEIGVATVAEQPELTFLHEAGHFLSHQAFGEPGAMNTFDAPELEEWRQAIVRTEAAQQLLYMLDRGGEFELVTPDGIIALPVDVDYVAYLVHPEELFARSYSQWIAARSGNATLLRQLDLERRSPYPAQWRDDDFSIVADAFDAIFDRQGWLR